MQIQLKLVLILMILKLDYLYKILNLSQLNLNKKINDQNLHKNNSHLLVQDITHKERKVLQLKKKIQNYKKFQ